MMYLIPAIYLAIGLAFLLIRLVSLKRKGWPLKTGAEFYCEATGYVVLWLALSIIEAIGRARYRSATKEGSSSKGNQGPPSAVPAVTSSTSVEAPTR